MGVEATFQAMPENCELFIAARQDRDIAELMQFFETYASQENLLRFKEDPKRLEFHTKARKVVSDSPGLLKRYFYAGSRTFDAIVYLLSPIRRSVTHQKDTSLIYQAIYGQEPLHPEAHATQGRPIRLVPAIGVLIIAEYL